MNMQAQSFYFLRERLRQHPGSTVAKTVERVYKKNHIVVGLPKGAKRLFDHVAKPHTVAVVGGAYGDEGKGRITDNKIEQMLKNKAIKLVRVVAYHGGNNAGRTVENSKIRIAVHALPAGILHERTECIIDQGTISHIEDLRTEVEYVEKQVGNLKGKVFLSEEAILCTDLERAEENLHAVMHKRSTSISQLTGGTTKKGIAPSYAHHIDKTGLKVHDILSANWKKHLSARYDTYKTLFTAFGMSLKNVQVSDFKTTKKIGAASYRSLGTKQEFLERMEDARRWLLRRKMVVDTMSLHEDSLRNIGKVGVVFEGVQGAGIDAWIGSRPDVTSSSTLLHTVAIGTGRWQLTDIQDRIGVIKGPYTSSVGARHLLTEIPLGKHVRSEVDLLKNASMQEKRAAFIRDFAHEFGTTSGRPRDIVRLDLGQTTYSAHMSGVEVLAVTLMDAAREEESIEVCTHYTRNNVPVPFRPGLRYQKDFVPHFITLPGWDGLKARAAKTFADLPENAQKYIAFLQEATGFPIVAITTGPKREHLIQLPGYSFTL